MKYHSRGVVAIMDVVLCQQNAIEFQMCLSCPILLTKGDLLDLCISIQCGYIPLLLLL